MQKSTVSANLTGREAYQKVEELLAYQNLELSKPEGAGANSEYQRLTARLITNTKYHHSSCTVGEKARCVQSLVLHLTPSAATKRTAELTPAAPWCPGDTRVVDAVGLEDA